MDLADYLEIYTEDQLRRLLAVQATGGVNDTTINAGDNVVGVAEWIINGDTND